LTGRQLMYGIIGFLALSVVVQQHWRSARPMLQRCWRGDHDLEALEPGLAWRRWRIARARARLKVMFRARATSRRPATSTSG